MFSSLDFPRYAFGGQRVKMLNVVGVGRHSRVERAVWRQSRTCLPKFIAVKCIPKTADASAPEIANHAKVSDHEHIVKFYGSYSDADTVYLKLQLVEDGTLLTAINERNLFQGNPPLVRTALLQLIDAVHYCHEQSVFHGDLKPGNILCSGKPEQLKLLLCDFGSSTDSPTSTNFTYERGSEMYVSPERLGEEFKLAVYSTKQSDIWSIGIIAINIISSRAPWEKAASSSAGFNRFLHDPAFLRSTFGISMDTQAILKRILMLNPMARISLPNLRAEIATVHSFFMVDENTPLSTPLMQYTARNSPLLDVVPIICQPASSQASTCSKGSLDSANDECIIYPSPVLAFEPLEQHEPQPMIAKIARSLSSDGSSSDEDSDGPITPFSAAVDVDVEVPELDLRDGSRFLRVPQARCRAASWSTGRLIIDKKYERPRAVSGARKGKKVL